MNNFYLFVLSRKIDRSRIIEWLTSKGAIQGWFFSINGTFFAQSPLSANKLSKLIIEKVGKERHFITKVTDDRQGILPKDHWELFYQK